MHGSPVFIPHYPRRKINLENIVNDINNKKEISFAIVTGNISKNGKNERT